MHVGDLLKKKLNRDQVASQPLPLCIFSAVAHHSGPAQRSADAIKLSGLLRRLGGLRSLSKEWAALFLLHRLAGTPSQLAYQNSAAAPLSAVGFGRPAGAALPDAFHSEGLRQVTQPAPPRPQSARNPAPPQPSERPGFEEYNRVVNTAFEVGEHALIRDMIFVLQGIDGKYVKYSRRADGFVVDAVRTPQTLFSSKKDISLLTLSPPGISAVARPLLTGWLWLCV